jgi:hypothetical protein
MTSKSPTFEDVLRKGDTSRFTTAADVHRIELVARDRPADLTDDEIALLAEYERTYAEDALNRRTKAQAVATNPPTPSQPAAPPIQIARWQKGEDHAIFVRRCRKFAASVGYVEAGLNGIMSILVKQLRTMNERNAERNQRLTSLETRLAPVEARLAGHSGSATDERLAGIERALAELQSQQATDGERIRRIESRPPALAYRGVYRPGETYQLGEVATWGGSMWHANKKTTAKPGDGSGDWTLCVKKGTDGKDGRDATK